MQRDEIKERDRAVLHHHRGFEIYNLGESHTTSLRELVRLIEEALGIKATIEVLEPQPRDVSTTYADIRKAKKMLGYQPKVKMEEGIQRVVEWYKNEKS